MPLSPGQIINNRYRIVKLLGQGGFGAVYCAWDTNLDEPIAIKESIDTSPTAQRKFKLEAKLLFKLVHPNLPRVHDHFVIPGLGQYLVMDFVEGQDLGEMLMTGPLPEDKVLPWIIQVCDALSYLHSQNPPVIHRDIKPGNIKITPEGKAMLVDFGISKIYDPTLVTTVGARAVTSGYSPPEQYGKGATDVRSDLYALGATLYHLLTGQLPPDSVDILTRNVPPPPPVVDLNFAISEVIGAAITKAMALDRESRWANVEEFKNAITTKPLPGSGKGETPLTATQIVTPPPLKRAVPALAGTIIKRFNITWEFLVVVGALGCGMVVVTVAGITLVIGRSTPTIIPTTEMVAALPSDTFSPQFTKPPVTQPATTEAPLIPTSLPVGFTDEHGIKMKLIPTGEFQMGSQSGESDERPVHTVYLDAFYIDIYETSNALFAQCVKAGVCTHLYSRKSDTRDSYYGNTTYDNYPVIYVYWEEARYYCEWRGARLPNEAEWEKAARGGLEAKIYPWGDQEPKCSRLNYLDCEGDTVQVDSYAPNGYGLFNMAGNVAEWVWDWYSDSYYDRSPSRNPFGPDSGTVRVLRGGGWGGGYSEFVRFVRVATRSWCNPDFTNRNIGFRCARSASTIIGTPFPTYTPIP